MDEYLHLCMKFGRKLRRNEQVGMVYCVCVVSSGHPANLLLLGYWMGSECVNQRGYEGDTGVP